MEHISAAVFITGLASTVLIILSSVALLYNRKIGTASINDSHIDLCINDNKMHFHVEEISFVIVSRSRKLLSPDSLHKLNFSSSFDNYIVINTTQSKHEFIINRSNNHIFQQFKTTIRKSKPILLCNTSELLNQLLDNSYA
ncbi:hypothetical protein [Hymenobacter coalescens]